MSEGTLTCGNSSSAVQAVSSGRRDLPPDAWTAPSDRDGTTVVRGPRLEVPRILLCWHPS